MKYFKDVLKVVIYVLIFYTPVALYSLWHVTQDVNKQAAKEAVSTLQSSNTLVKNLIAKNQSAEACQQLQAEQRAGRLVAYQVQSSDFVCSFPDSVHAMPVTQANGRVEAFELSNIPVLVVRDQEAGAEWYLALNSPAKASIFEYLQNESIVQWAFFQEILMVIYTALALVVFAVLMMAKVIQSQFKDGDSTPKWVKSFFKLFSGLQLHDLTIVRRATQVTTAFITSQKKDKDLLETSLEESILHEIRENHHSIPYSFDGTVTKVDINGFSKVVASGQSNQAYYLTNSLEEFGCELLKRYDGLYEKTVGDEIVAVFKTKDSQKLAAAYARDLMREFSQKVFLVSDKDERRFTLKSSISSSRITFRKRPSGYGFDGDALTHTTRLLETITEKSVNTMSCQVHEADKISELCKIPAQAQTFELKNMSAVQGYWINAWSSVEDIYTQAPTLLQFFRSDSDILTILKLTRQENDLNRISHAFSTLRKIQVHLCSVEVLLGWRETLSHFHQRAQQDKKYAEILSDIIMLGKTLIPTHQWNEECSAAVLNISRNIEDRINASVAEVLAEKGVPSLVIENERNLISGAPSNSFRTKGNILLAHAIQKLDDKVFVDLIKMMNSNNKLERHTGVYCTYNVIDHYKKQNPALLELCSHYEKAEQLLLKIRENDKDLSPRLREMTATI
ncbi:hypothetical protein [Bdellovibrio sp. HCB2-146]|uniref:hypothetical protein n=1 Tax=Bdellovibrio sp. HCB2-146 TaxID=3394362 RepID=UPI0039BD88E6